MIFKQLKDRHIGFILKTQLKDFGLDPKHWSVQIKNKRLAARKSAILRNKSFKDIEIQGEWDLVKSGEKYQLQWNYLDLVSYFS